VLFWPCCTCRHEIYHNIHNKPYFFFSLLGSTLSHWARWGSRHAEITMKERIARRKSELAEKQSPTIVKPMSLSTVTETQDEIPQVCWNLWKLQMRNQQESSDPELKWQKRKMHVVQKIISWTNRQTTVNPKQFQKEAIETSLEN